MLPTLNNMQQQQQETHHHHHQIIMQPKAVKQTKVRRTRQPRNPQLSVARRNERERNRVKMVNNGFALLREHLPVEDLQASMEQSGSDTPTPDGGSIAGGKSSSSKAKKFSKVETLRAAIQRIKMLEELIRTTEPGFQSINLTSSALAYDEEGEEDDGEMPLSIGEPLSCGSSHSNSNSNSNQVPITTTTATIRDNHHFQHQQTLYHHNSHISHTQEQFIKLEPQTTCSGSQLQAIHNLPSPQNSQASGCSSISGPNTNNIQYQQQQHQATQVHPNLHQLDHHHQQPLPHQHQHQRHLVVPLSPTSGSQQQEPSHTHLWIQQHQSSFLEQQQQQQQQQLQYDQQMGNNWYSQQQQQGNWFVQTTESPEQINSHHHQQHPIQAANDTNQQAPLQHPNQVESPVWQYASSSPSTTAQTTASPQLPQMPAFGHQHHQISLYSQ